MAKNKLVFEKDEKKSIIIALIISAVVVLAVVLALIAIKKHNGNQTASRGDGDYSVTTQSTESRTVLEDNSIVVNQEELNIALEDAAARAVMIQTEEAENIVIPSGDYSTIDLIIDAPYTEITNYGKFASITINQIASNTWTESADYNSIVVDSPACHIIVPAGVTVNSIQNVQAGATLAIENQGTISEMYLMSDASITSIQADGTIGMLSINNYTNLNLTGTCKTMIPVSVAYGADGTAISVAVPVDISIAASSTFSSEAGSEGSKVEIASNTCTVKVTNNTEEDLAVKNGDGKDVKIKAGKEKSFEASATTDSGSSEQDSESREDASASSGGGSSSGGSSSGGSSGGGSSGGGSSSGGSSSGGSGKDSNDDGDIADKIEKAIEEALEKPYIIGFEEIPSIYAGVEGSTLTKAEVIKKLPSVVKAYASNGDILDIKVSSKHWKNDGGYNDKATEGEYKFTATMSSTSKYYVSSKVKIEVMVFVKSGDKDYTIAFDDNSYKNLIDVKEYRVFDYDSVKQTYIAAYYKLTNNTKGVKKIDLEYKYYDSKGTEITQNTDRWYGVYIESGDSWIAERRRPCFDYDYYVVTVKLTDPPLAVPVKKNVICTYDFKNSNGREVNCAVSKINQTNTTECTVKVLYLGEQNGALVAYGLECFATGSMEVQSINNEAGISCYTFTLPAGSSASTYEIATLGGYEQ